MALKLRVTDVKPHDYLSRDPQINAMIEIFDDASGRVFSRGNLAYSGAELGKLSQTSVRKRLNDDALVWAAEQKAAYEASPEVANSSALIGRLQALIGAELDIP